MTWREHSEIEFLSLSSPQGSYDREAELEGVLELLASHDQSLSNKELLDLENPGYFLAKVRSP